MAARLWIPAGKLACRLPLRRYANAEIANVRSRRSSWGHSSKP